MRPPSTHHHIANNIDAGDLEEEWQEAREGHVGWDSQEILSAEVVFGHRCQQMKKLVGIPRVWELCKICEN